MVVTRDPGSSEVGLKIREILLGSDLHMHRRTEAMLFMASRCEMVESTIRPALSAGKSVIADRFLLANVVYQSVNSAGETVEPSLLWEMGDLANGGLRPELTLLLDMPAEVSIQRIGREHDRMESRGVDYLEAVRQAYLRELPRASDHTAIINADQSADQVSEAIRDVVDRFLSQRS